MNRRVIINLVLLGMSGSWGLLRAEELDEKEMTRLVRQLEDEHFEHRHKAILRLRESLSTRTLPLFKAICSKQKLHSGVRVKEICRFVELGFEPGAWERLEAICTGVPEGVLRSIRNIQKAASYQGPDVGFGANEFPEAFKVLYRKASSDLLRKLANSSCILVRVYARSALKARGALGLTDIERALYDDAKYEGEMVDGDVIFTSRRRCFQDALTWSEDLTPPSKLFPVWKRYLRYGRAPAVVGYILEKYGALGQMGLQRLLSLTKGRDKAGQDLRAGALSALGYEDPERVVPVLKEALFGTRSNLEKLAAMKGMVQLGQKGSPLAAAVIIGLLEDEKIKEDLKRKALEAVATLGLAPIPEGPVLLEKWVRRDPNSNLAYVAAEGLARLSQAGSDKAQRILKKLLRDPSEEMKCVVVIGFAKQGDPKNWVFVEPFLKDRENKLVRTIVKWGFPLGGQQVVPVIDKALRSESKRMRRSAAMAVRDLPEELFLGRCERALKILMGGFPDPYADVLAERLLNVPEKKALPIVLRMIRAAQCELLAFSFCAYAMEYAPRKTARKALIEMYRVSRAEDEKEKNKGMESHPFVRLAAISELRTLNDPSLLPVLKRALTDSFRKTRIAPASALARFGSQEAVNGLLEVAQKHTDPKIRIDMLYGLSELKPAEALKYLEPFLLDKNQKIQENAIWAVTAVKGPGVRELLEKKLEAVKKWPENNLNGSLFMLRLEKALEKMSKNQK